VTVLGFGLGDTDMSGMRNCDFRFNDVDQSILVSLLSAVSTNPETYAVRILGTFDTFHEATRADHAILAEMISDNGARLLRTIPKAVASITREKIRRAGTYVSTVDAAKVHFAALLNGRRNEALAVVYLNATNRMIGDDIWEGSIDRVNIYPREISRRAIMLDASSMIIAHNHPSGNACPNGEDIAVTRRLERSLDAIDVLLFDHFIFGDSDVYSMKQNVGF